MKKIKIILFIVVCFLPVLLYVEMFSRTNFNWFAIPKPLEIYLQSYDTSASQQVSFVVHSSEVSQCIINYCGLSKTVILNKGDNPFQEPVQDCAENFLVAVECGQSRLSFRCSRDGSSEGKEEYGINLTASPSAGFVETAMLAHAQTRSSGYRAIRILLDGQEVMQPSYFFPQGDSTRQIMERINAGPGEHTISAFFEGSSSESTVTVAAPSYPYAMLATLVLLLVLAILLSSSMKLDFCISLLLFFMLLSSSLVFQFHLTGLGINEWAVPFLSGIITVLVWKKMQ